MTDTASKKLAGWPYRLGSIINSKDESKAANFSYFLFLVLAFAFASERDIQAVFDGEKPEKKPSFVRVTVLNSACFKNSKWKHIKSEFPIIY